MKLSLIFDIGRTNKKCLLFDENYQLVFKEYINIVETKDEDGFPCDDLEASSNWMKGIFERLLKERAFDISALNFSGYGASFVHVDGQGNACAPLYSYLKPYPEELLAQFYNDYGDEQAFARKTASPPLKMLNSGLQLYWLKYRKASVFRNIKYSLHLPQYLSFLFSGKALSDYTSIGCHTGLWNFDKSDYHPWVYAEGINQKLAPIVPTHSVQKLEIAGRSIKVGAGIHDSSAALLPYLLSDPEPFLLISTGTWSISLNPFSDQVLSEEDLFHDCLNFMRMDGKVVRAARIFLGNEYGLQLRKLCAYFGIAYPLAKEPVFEEVLYAKLKHSFERKYAFESIGIRRDAPEKTKLSDFEDFEEAYHQLMIELVEMQVLSARLAIGNTEIGKIYIDGGFVDNEVYIKLLGLNFEGKSILTAKSPIGSALGAAMLINEKPVSEGFLKENYALRTVQ